MHGRGRPPPPRRAAGVRGTRRSSTCVPWLVPARGHRRRPRVRCVESRGSRAATLRTNASVAEAAVATLIYQIYPDDRHFGPEAIQTLDSMMSSAMFLPHEMYPPVEVIQGPSMGITYLARTACGAEVRPADGVPPQGGLGRLGSAPPADGGLFCRGTCRRVPRISRRQSTLPVDILSGAMSVPHVAVLFAGRFISALSWPAAEASRINPLSCQRTTEHVCPGTAIVEAELTAATCASKSMSLVESVCDTNASAVARIWRQSSPECAVPEHRGDLLQGIQRIGVVTLDRRSIGRIRSWHGADSLEVGGADRSENRNIKARSAAAR